MKNMFEILLSKTVENIAVAGSCCYTQVNLIMKHGNEKLRLYNMTDICTASDTAAYSKSADPGNMV